MKGKKYIKQINNLKIYFTEWFRYCVISPYNIVLEDRMTLEQAENFCNNTFDFTIKRGVNNERSKNNTNK